MPTTARLGGVYAAAITPLKPDYTPDLEAIPLYLDFLWQRGCQGALLLGTTGEGPSFSPPERLAILRTATKVRSAHPDFHLLAGTGTPSLDETIALTRSAFDLGLDGVIVLPPYYYRKVPDDGLYEWFKEVLLHAVPQDGVLLGYHIPPITGVPLSFGLLRQLKDSFPTTFAGIKDSSNDPEHALQVGKLFGNDFLILNGNDRLFSLAMEAGASGCITALANLFSPDLRRVWEGFKNDKPDQNAQDRLNTARTILERYPPFPPLIKALLPRLHKLPHWQVRPPLLPVSPDTVNQAWESLNDAGTFTDAVEIPAL